MAALQLASVRLTATHVVYLDTSALTSLVMVEAEKHGQPPAAPLERRRASDLTQFFKRAQSVGASVITTSLVLEEELARMRNVSREDGARAASKGKHGYRQLKQQDPKAAAAVDRQAWTNMVHTIHWSAAVLTAGFVKLDLPPIAGSGTTHFAGVLRTDHEALMQNCNEIDAMDALHIAVGSHMKATAFISFDRGWRSVPGIDVYYS